MEGLRADGSDKVGRALVSAAAAGPALVMVVLTARELWDATLRASWATLGRDQGIFQYVAWATAHGDRLYRDVRDVNGPLVALIHTVFLALGGADEHRFRVLDLVTTSLGFAVVGAALPSLGRASRDVRAPVRAAWACGTTAVLLAQYLLFTWWNTAQRESFFDGLVLVGMGAQLVAQGMWRRGSRLGWGETILLVVAGACSLAPWFGKPTFALFTIAAVVALVVDDVPIGRLRRLAPFAIGGVVGALVPLSFLVLRGDVGAFLRISSVEVPAMYRFIWARPASSILLMPGYATLTWQAAATAGVLGMLVVWGRLPRRALPLAAMPALGLVSAVVQAKGFPYHFHPVTLGTQLGWVAFVAWLSANFAPTQVLFVRLVPFALSLVLGARASRLAALVSDPPVPPSTEPAYLRGEERLALFERVDFSPRALVVAADFLRAHTREGDTVQTYGMDPYLLFLAERRSATPYIYAYDLDADAALAGAWEEGGARPDDAQRRVIAALRDAHETDLRERIAAHPPAAFVFVDRSPLMSSPDAVSDFAAHCPTVAPWVGLHYAEALDAGGVRVWLRKN